MEGSPRLRMLSYVVIIYMLLAFSWWSVLLYVKNNDAFEAKTTYLKLIKIGSKQVNSESEFLLSPEYLDLRSKYKRQEYMIFGEAIVFIFSLMAGIWLINRGYHREVQLARQKRNFLLSVTHELKSPLASIRLILETVQKRKLSEEQKQQLTESGIKENDRLTTLVNNLLTATRLETIYKPTKEPINILTLVDEEINRLKLLHPGRKLNLKKENSLPEMNLDRTGIVSVISNLVENAIKYSNENTEVDIQISLKEDNLLIQVADHGIGIDLEEKQKIFTQFYRSGNEDTRNTKGTGLGLYIVKQIVAAHKGKIKVKENFPTGTIFEVTLPLNQ
ncbi:MAG: GHKL domain-containing protein [Saprospiraceae bacterium]|jgi:two-component system phosphate regulon sensor histidine kinase PhoR|nr:GHKL domain-containing protein [Saprospiraceae bacterium]